MCSDFVVVGQVTGSFFMAFVCFDIVVVGQVTGPFFMESVCFDSVVVGQVMGPFFVDVVTFSNLCCFCARSKNKHKLVNPSTWRKTSCLR